MGVTQEQPPHLAAEALLAPYACRASASRGRLVAEPDSATRNAYQRDRDRIIHATAFRRLKHKTQVFVYHEGDHYRTRLTHSLEVAQIARSLARALRLSEDLAEALALAHDLGHPPFGHAGETVLNEAMAPYGGFDHNAQTLRLVTELERRYPAYDGLNLTWESLEGLAKHNGPLVERAIDPANPPAHLPFGLRAYLARHDLEIESWSSAEAQIAAIADDVAYNNHDIDDGLRAGLFSLEALGEVAPVGRVLAAIESDHGQLPETVLIHELVRRLIGQMVEDILAETRRRLDELGARSPADVRGAGAPVVAFSPEWRRDIAALRDFLWQHMYRHRFVMRTTSKAKRVVRALFDLYMDEPELMPAEWTARAGAPKTPETARAAADFIAGMTDRFAIREYRKLFDISAFLV